MAVKIIDTDNCTVLYDADADATVEKDMLDGPCVLHGIFVLNDDAATNHLKLYDNIDPTVGTTAPDIILPLTTDATDPPKGGMYFPINAPDGIAFTNGLSAAVVSEAGTAGTTAPTLVRATFLVVRG